MGIFTLSMIEVIVATFIGSFIGCFFANVVSTGLFGFSKKIQSCYEQKREKRAEDDQNDNHNSG